MPTGPVKWFDPKKGYGFIVGPEGQDVFVHYSHIQTDGFRTLKDGEEVDYELIQGEKGWQARGVSPAQSTGSAPAAKPSTGDASESVPPLAAGYEGSGENTTATAPPAGGYESA